MLAGDIVIIIFVKIEKEAKKQTKLSNGSGHGTLNFMVRTCLFFILRSISIARNLLS